MIYPATFAHSSISLRLEIKSAISWRKRQSTQTETLQSQKNAQSTRLAMVASLTKLPLKRTGLHLHDEAFGAISLSEDIQQITREIGFRDPRMLQSMIICKPPEIGGKGMSVLIPC
jgi:hypothetical protein